MGRYRRNRCSFCYGAGHNKTTCPEIKKRVEDEIAREGRYATGEAKSWFASSYEDRQKRRANKKRECSYCNETGHNIRSCVEFKNNINVVLKIRSQFASAMLETCIEAGFLLGSLVQITSAPYSLRKSPKISTGIVAGFNFANVKPITARIYGLYNDCSIYRGIMELNFFTYKSFDHNNGDDRFDIKGYLPSELAVAFCELFCDENQLMQARDGHEQLKTRKPLDYWRHNNNSKTEFLSPRKSLESANRARDELKAYFSSTEAYEAAKDSVKNLNTYTFNFDDLPAVLEDKDHPTLAFLPKKK